MGLDVVFVAGHYANANRSVTVILIIVLQARPELNPQPLSVPSRGDIPTMNCGRPRAIGVARAAALAEADIQYQPRWKSRCILPRSAPWALIIFAQVGPGRALSIHEDFNGRWLATFRGRLGWLFTPTALVYATGGLALAH